MSQNNHQSGFTLIEVSIVLAILGVVIGISLPILNKHYINTKIAVTKERMEHITYVLAGYAKTHDHIPYPSLNENDGKAQTSSEGRVQLYGYIPYQTLGIDESVSKDAFGKKFVYIVDAAFANSSGAQGNKEKQETRKSGSNLRITVKNDDADEYQATNTKDKNDFIAFILISSGAGSEPLNAAEHNNLAGGPYTKRPFNKEGKDQFRQIVKWETRNNLAAAYGKDSSSLKAPPPMDINPPTNAPGPAVGTGDTLSSVNAGPPSSDTDLDKKEPASALAFDSGADASSVNQND